MDPNSQEVISTPDGVTVDMSYYNQPHFRRAIEEDIDDMLLKKYMDKGLTFQEAITLQLYHCARVVARGYKGKWADLFDKAEREHNDGL